MVYRIAQLIVECDHLIFHRFNVQQVVTEISKDFLLSNVELLVWASYL